jgi:hypothetical protein
VQYLRGKGYLAETAAGTGSRGGFSQVRLEESLGQHAIELKTQLANGQWVWMSVAAEQLPVVLEALSA